MIMKLSRRFRTVEGVVNKKLEWPVNKYFENKIVHFIRRILRTLKLRVLWTNIFQVATMIMEKFKDFADTTPYQRNNWNQL